MLPNFLLRCTPPFNVRKELLAPVLESSPTFNAAICKNRERDIALDVL